MEKADKISCGMVLADSDRLGSLVAVSGVARLLILRRHGKLVAGFA